MIWGDTIEQLDNRFAKVLGRFNRLGLKINLKKCTFATQKLIFAGHHISPQGVSPDPNKVNIIQNAKTPSNVSEIKSFLGMINYSSQYIQNYSTISEPLRRLTKKSESFTWGETQQAAFDKLRSEITKAPVMAFYNPVAETHLTVDASPVGLGAILAQKSPDGKMKPIAYGSRALTDTESRYSQTEREALAVLWACKHFHHYTYDRHIIVNSDHKPLERLLTTSCNPPPRIQRWILHLQAYDYTINYIPGNKNAADYYLSRYITSDTPLSQSEIDAEQYTYMVTNDAIPISIQRLSEIALETKNDTVLSEVIKSVHTARWKKTLRPYFQIRHQLSTKQGILMKDHQIIIPKTLRHRTLQLAHQHHQGISKTKALLREKVWWPGMASQVDELIKSCHQCQVNTPSVTKCEPLKMTEIPQTSWETLAIDLKGPLPTGEHILVVIDYRSRYPALAVMKSITSQNIIKALTKIFATFGYPNLLTSDNGKQFTSQEFKDYLKQHGIKLRVVTPYWPSANGEVERFNRTLGKFIKCTHSAGKDWRKELNGFLLQYRTTPHSTTGKPPASLLFKHKVKNDLPTFQNKANTAADKEINQRDKSRKENMKQFADNLRKVKTSDIKQGQLVLIKDIKPKSKTIVLL